jgi:hypothetical protein
MTAPILRSGKDVSHTDALPRLFMEEECDSIDTGFDDRDPARECDRPRHHIGDAEPDGQVDLKIGKGIDQIAGHGPSPANANPSKLRTTRNKRQIYL